MQALSQWEIEQRGEAVSSAPDNIASKDWAYNPADPNQGWDNGSVPPIDNQPNYKSYNRLDLRDVADNARNPAPEMLRSGKTRAEADEIVQKAVLGSADERIVQTPAGDVLINKNYLKHITAKESDRREQFANYIVPTLEKPYEVYVTQYADGTRRMRYIGLFEGNEGMGAITLNRDGSILWNAIKTSSAKLNSFRVGWLIYGK